MGVGFSALDWVDWMRMGSLAVSPAWVMDGLTYVGRLRCCAALASELPSARMALVCSSGVMIFHA